MEQVDTNVPATDGVDARQKIEHLKEVAKEKVGELRQKAHDGYEKASHKVHDAIDKAKDASLNDVCDSVTNYVKENPGKSVALAAGTGLLLGLLIAGRRR